MKAFILAAGLGTRLYPFTSDRPKALVELGGVTLLERAIRKVNELDVSEIVINIHHFGEQIVSFLKDKQNFNLQLRISDESGQLLDTGGAILKAKPLLENGEPILIYNVDVLSSLDLTRLVLFHREKKGIATLCVRNRNTDRYLVFDPEMRLSGWRNIRSGEEIITRTHPSLQNFAFSGIQIIEPGIFPLITESGKFSVIQLYMRISKEHDIFGYHDQSDLWMDLGKPDQLAEAEKIISDFTT